MNEKLMEHHDLFADEGQNPSVIQFTSSKML
jgi:hypothetical protein